jgi:hypothetical protein
MDLTTAAWILFWGLIPPIIVGYWAYRQGIKGRDEALAMRDEALERADAALAAIKALPPFPPMPHVPTVDDIIKALPDVPEPDYEVITADIKKAVLASMDGYMGTVEKKLKDFGEKIDKALSQTGNGGGGPPADDLVFKLMNKFL